MQKIVQYFQRYGLGGFIGLGIHVLKTKLLFPNAKIIRFPIIIRGKKQIQIGNLFVTGVGCRLEVDSDNYSLKEKKLIIGDNVQINDYVHIAAIKKVTIKDNVLIASKVFITDHNHGNYSGEENDSPDSIPIERPLYSDEVIIEENVWIGEFVSILPGVTIGKGSIIGTMSVVNRDIPPYSIAVGCPARVIKRYNEIKKIWEKV